MSIKMLHEQVIGSRREHHRTDRAYRAAIRTTFLLQWEGPEMNQDFRITFQNVPAFYCEEIASCQILKVEDHPLFIVYDCLFNLHAATF
jgi:hypothetical protein